MTTTAKVAKLEKEFSFINNVKFEHLLAGLSGGLVSTLTLHPLDVIKIRFAVHDGRMSNYPKYTGIANAFKTIWKQEGIQGLYRGVTPNAWGAASSWGLYFLFYNSIKTTIQKGNTQQALGPGYHLLAASEAGACTLLFTNPLWVVKTRLCLQCNYDCDTVKAQRYNGMIDALVKIYKSEGIRGYYKGFVPGLFGVSHGAVQFMAYEEMKNKYNQYKKRPITTKLETLEYLSFAAISKFIAASSTYPYQVVRARLQNQHYSYKGMWDCILMTWTFEGWRGFYKGLGTNLLRVTPATMITFVTYENVSYALMENKNTS